MPQSNHQIAMSTDQIELLIKGQTKQQQSIDQLAIHILKLTTLISGNEFDKDDKGMVGELRDANLRIASLEKEVQQNKVDKKSNRKYIAGFVAATTIFWAVIQFLVNYYANHYK